ncbi:hypothetical protein QKU48_gp0259 [Fadolivirus algeromassiliense]|jgi:hypothetical protein|uniref:Uncharacterized protein n=1 Tax=Fadolivirus FV1/VV64 TaxID=3070911 RepID=A0A7D3V8L4_9VIRU|nr:hypothetical protein QKU48_gp0259 [Fadolivirus algeromassiliense]QKF93717.1 hypothetical protein Fadolivirus_1_259 [Fadolivirus FV1/VV64]
MDLDSISIESLLDNITPEILGLFPDDRFLTPNNFQDMNYPIHNDFERIVYSIYNYLPARSIIEILHEIRENKNCMVYESDVDALRGMLSNKLKLSYLLEKINMNDCKYTDNKVSFKLRMKGDTIESLIFDDLDKIKNIRITSGEGTVLFDSLDRLDHTQMKDYTFHNKGNIMKGLLISDYNIPIISIHFDEIIMEIEFIDEYVHDDKTISIIYTMLDRITYGILGHITYELDMQPGRFVIYSNGMAGEHFLHDDGDLSEKYQNGNLDIKRKELFDLAHKEADRRKNLSKKY